jgi:hypothetical protein
MQAGSQELLIGRIFLQLIDETFHHVAVVQIPDYFLDGRYVFVARSLEERQDDPSLLGFVQEQRHWHATQILEASFAISTQQSEPICPIKRSVFLVPAHVDLGEL